MVQVMSVRRSQILHACLFLLLLAGSTQGTDAMHQDQKALCAEIASSAKEKFLELHKQRPQVFKFPAGQSYQSEVSFYLCSGGEVSNMSIDTHQGSTLFDLLSLKSLQQSDMPLRKNDEDLKVHVTFILNSNALNNLSITVEAEPRHK